MGWAAYLAAVGGAAYAADHGASAAVQQLVDYLRIGDVSYANADILNQMHTSQQPGGPVVVDGTFFTNRLNAQAVGLRVVQFDATGAILDPLDEGIGPYRYGLVDRDNVEVQAGIRVNVENVPLENASGRYDIAYVVRTNGDLVTVDYFTADTSGGATSVVLVARDPAAAVTLANSMTAPGGDIDTSLIEDSILTSADKARAIEQSYQEQKEGLVATQGQDRANEIAKATVQAYKKQIFDGRPISFGQLGALFGSNLARLVETDNVWESLGVGTLLATIGLNIGQQLDLEAGHAFDRNGNPIRAFDDFPSDLASAGIGAVGSYLFAELVNDLGLDGIGGQALDSVGGAVIGQIAYNLVTPAWILNGQVVSAGTEGAVQGHLPWNNGITPSLVLNAAGAFLGGFLASKLVHFDTIEGQIGASIGSAIGSIIATSVLLSGKVSLLLNFIIPGIGAFVGFILGGLIGSLFGSKPNPQSGASLGFNAAQQKFVVANVWTDNNAQPGVARSLATNVAETLNSVLSATGAKLADAAGVRVGVYGQAGVDGFMDRSDKFWNKDPNVVIRHGLDRALRDLAPRLIGGDVYAKRALAATLAQTVPGANGYLLDPDTLYGNLSTAQDYSNYLQNAAAINALIAAEPESAFTAGWTITFARAMELGLDKRGATDWSGGWAAFLDETADGAIDGKAFTPANLTMALDPDSNERLFAFTDKDGALIGVLGDTIDSASKDVIAGTAGNDAIGVNADTVTLTSALTLNGAAATAGDYKIRIAALIDGGAGDDAISGGDLGNDLLGGDGNDTLIGGKLDDWLFGGAGADRLFAGAPANTSFTIGDVSAEAAAVAVDGGNGDYLEGGDGDDALYGSTGSDWLNGGAGVDRIVGGAGGDVIQGGAGDDRAANGAAMLMGGAGSDQYMFNIGDGADVIFVERDPAVAAGTAYSDFAARIAAMSSGALAPNWAGHGDYEVDGSVKGGEDAIAFGAGIDFRDLVLRRSGTEEAPGQDLIIELTARDENGARVPTGDSLTVQDWFDATRRVEWLRFADGEDIRIGDLTATFVGTAASDVIIGSYGSDFLLDGDGDDQIRGLAGADFGFGGRGRDFVAGDENNDWVLGGDDDDKVIGGQGNDTAFGDDGSDEVYGGDGADLIAGGLGDDTIIAGAGDDIIEYQRGDGRDTVYDDYSNNWENVWVAGAYVNGYSVVDGDVVKNGQTYFEDGAWIGDYDWADSAQILRRHLGADSNGALTSNAGDDTLEFGIGIDIQDVIVRRVGGDLELSFSASELDATALDDIADKITLKEWFTTGKQIEHFSFVEAGALNTAGWSIGAVIGDGADTIDGGAGSDWLTGAGGDDALRGLGGDDILSGNQGNDHILGGDGADVLYGGAGADKLFGGDGFDVASYANDSHVGEGVRVSLSAPALNTLDAAGDAFDGIEGLEGSGRADQLTGDSNGNLLRGLAGDDLLKGGGGDDAYEIGRNDGADTIQDGAISVEEILSADGTLNASLFTATWTQLSDVTNAFGTWKAYRLIVTRNGTGEQVYASRDGVDFLYATAQASAPAGTAWPFADGQWLGGAQRTGDGVQTLREAPVAGDGGEDAVEFGDDISLSDLTAAWENSNKDLRISIAGGGSALLKDQNDPDRAIEFLSVDDGLTARLDMLGLPGASGTAGDDLFLGGGSADMFAGGAGNDVISGGAGDDNLSGGDGDDVLEGGAGADVLDGGADSVTADHAALAGDLTRNYGDTIRYAGSDAGVVVDLSTGMASGGHAQGDLISGIENILGSRFADTLTGGDGANRLAGLAGDDVVSGGAGDDVLAGGAGNDSLYGGDGADAITGDDGDDLIDGGAGADLLSGAAGADQIWAQDGDDQLDGGDGGDVLYGGAGKDVISGAAGADTLYGDDGDDTLSGGEDSETLFGGAGADRSRRDPQFRSGRPRHRRYRLPGHRSACVVVRAKRRQPRHLDHRNGRRHYDQGLVRDRRRRRARELQDRFRSRRGALLDDDRR